MRRAAESGGSLKNYIVEIPPVLGKKLQERSSVIGATGKSVAQVCNLACSYSIGCWNSSIESVGNY